MRLMATRVGSTGVLLLVDVGVEVPDLRSKEEFVPLLMPYRLSPQLSQWSDWLHEWEVHINGWRREIN